MPIDEVSARPGRRALIVGAAGLGAAAGLAACGAPAGPAAPAAPPTGHAPAAPGPPPDPDAGGGGAGTRLGPVADVPVGGGRVYPELEVVVTQATAGAFRGFTAICTHTGCTVDRVADRLIRCPCHGSRFRLDGTVEHGPAPRALPARAVTVVDGELRLA